MSDKGDYKDASEEIADMLIRDADDWAKKRKPYTDQWVRTYYRYIGKYRPDQLAAMSQSDGQSNDQYSVPFEEGGWNKNNWRSTAFIKLPKVKVLGAYSQMIQSALLNKYKVEVEPKAGGGEAEKVAANAMRDTINSQLETSQIEEVLKVNLLEKTMYGSTFAQAPVVNQTINRIWVRNAMKSMMRRLIGGGDVWEPQVDAKNQPYIYNRNLFEMFPDPFAVDIQSCKGIFHRPFIGEYELVDLAKKPGFDGKVIAEILRAGDYKQSSQDGTKAKRIARGLGGDKEGYDLVFFSGKLNAGKLDKAGLREFKDLKGWVEVLCWMVNSGEKSNPKIIKAVPNPLAKRPFYMSKYEQIPYELNGVGLGENVGEPCDVINGGVRLFLDSKKMALPQIAIDKNALPQGTTIVSFAPGKLWALDGKPTDVFSSFSLPDVSSGIIPLIEVMERFLDEISVPAYTTGRATKNINKTASGLSMLMSQYQVQMRAALENLNSMLEQIGHAFYDWNMEHNPDSRIKGDFIIKAAGLSTLMQKEVQNQQLMQFLQITSNPAIVQNPVTLKLLRMLGENIGIQNVDQILPRPEDLENQIKAIMASQMQTLQGVSAPGAQPMQAAA